MRRLAAARSGRSAAVWFSNNAPQGGRLHGITQHQRMEFINAPATLMQHEEEEEEETAVTIFLIVVRLLNCKFNILKTK